MHSFPKLFLFSASFPSLCRRRAGARAQHWHFWGLPSMGAAGASPEQAGDGGNRQDRPCRGLCLAGLSHPRGWPQAKQGPGEETTLGWWCSVLALAVPYSSWTVSFLRRPAAFLGAGTKRCWIAAVSAAPLRQPLCWDTGAFDTAVSLFHRMSSSWLNAALVPAEQEHFQQSPMSAIRTMTWDQPCLGAGCADGPCFASLTPA